MKKKFALVLAGLMTLSLFGCGNAATETPAATTTETPAATEAPAETAEQPAEEASGMDALIEAAKADGELVVYGSCEEEYRIYRRCGKLPQGHL